MNDYHELLGSHGPLAHHVPGFRPRAAQQHMADAVATAIRSRDTLIVEAGTGTGKTFAYLLPAVHSGRKVIISTGTRHLQDQLYHHDLPLVREALKAPIATALLKGRTNYLCLHRLALTVGEGRNLDRRQLHELEQIRAWSARTRSGDIAGLGEIPEDSPVWPRVTSTVDNCLGTECESFRDCFVVRARRAAMEADVLVINHHLLFADIVLREEGFGELLPGVDAIIVDEAHQIPEVASVFFGASLSSHQLHELIRDVQIESLREAADMSALPEAAQQLEGTIRRIRLALGQGDRRIGWSDFGDENPMQEPLQELAAGLNRLTNGLQAASERGKGLDSCRERATELLERLNTLLGKPAEEYIPWFETRRQSFRLNLTPLNVAPPLTKAMEGLPGAWIFTSATLAVGADFGHFASRLGLDQAHTLQLESPFDYEHNALLYLPEAMPDPAERDYTRVVVEFARQVLAASRGRAFLLFTSHTALQEAAKLLDGSVPYPLLVQGSAPRADLLDRFRLQGNAVLLGTSSFWEGVDVRGEALSCVIIDRLPFASPGDPVLKARSEALRRQGRNPFREYQLPNAVIALKQGAGRLIRDVADRGVLVLCDPRLRQRSYGRVFLESLPRMRRTSTLQDVRDFFAADVPAMSAMTDQCRMG
jgi:ATP-dependent DNA helicase DinG